MTENLLDFERTLDFQKILDKIAQKKDGKVHIKMSHKYSPTELSGCIRNAYYSRLFPEAFTNESYRNFLHGNELHELFQSNLEKEEREKVLKEVFQDKIVHIENEKGYQFLLPFEKTEGKRILISGRLDTIFYLKDLEKPIIVDYKTTSNAYYNRDAPKEGHVDQLNFYLATNLADYGMIVYIDKRNLSIIQHTVKYDQNRFIKMMDYAIALDTALETSKVPIVTPTLMDNEGNCRYCRHKERCKQLEKNKLLEG